MLRELRHLCQIETYRNFTKAQIRILLIALLKETYRVEIQLLEIDSKTIIKIKKTKQQVS